MKRDLIKYQLDTSFLSYEKDVETILRKLFVESRPYSDDLKKMLIINTKDCLEPNPAYDNLIQKYNMKDLMDKEYIKLIPKIRFPEHADVKSYIIISLDDFMINDTNPEFRDCSVFIDIVCHLDCWTMQNYQIRPMKICGYIDGLLNKAKLSGIGVLNFISCTELILNEELAGYTLVYRAIHGSDDRIPPTEE